MKDAFESEDPKPCKKVKSDWDLYNELLIR